MTICLNIHIPILGTVEERKKAKGLEKKKVVDRNLAIALGVLCVVIMVGAVVGITILMSQVSSLNSQVSSLNIQISSLQSSLSAQQQNSTALLNSLIIAASSSSLPFTIGSASTLQYTFGGSSAATGTTVLSMFENLYPTITVAPFYYAGSGVVATAENTSSKSFSLEAAADTTTMPRYLFPKLANYEIAFGVTQMVIITNLGSPNGLQLYKMWKGAQNLTVNSAQYNQTWANMFNFIALNSTTKIGFSNPFADPSGYQGAGMIRLAGLTFAGGNSSYYFDALYNNPSKYYMATTETTLVTLMQTDHIDFIISAYLANALSQVKTTTENLTYITLPTSINLGVLSNLNYYQKANYGGSIFSALTGGITASQAAQSFLINPVTYTLTIPTVSTNPAAATLFIKTLLSPTGQSLMLQNGIVPITPAIVYGNTTTLPGIITPLTTPVNSTYSSLFPS
jgi:molybdate/tungstate transport system substrate-binding protein